MSLDILSDLTGTERKRGTPCFLAILRTSEPMLAEQAERGIASTHSADAVAAWLRERGVEISGPAIQRHRRGICRSCQTTS